MMSYILNIALVFNVLVSGADTTSPILTGEIFPGYRVIIMDIHQDEIIIEIGGTSLKMGGDIIQLQKIILEDKNEIIALSKMGNSYIKKKNNNIYFVYDGKLGNRKFKLKSKKYTDEIDKIRFNIFRSYFYDVEGKSLKFIQDEFDTYKINPSAFLH